MVIYFVHGNKYRFRIKIEIIKKNYKIECELFCMEMTQIKINK